MRPTGVVAQQGSAAIVASLVLLAPSLQAQVPQKLIYSGYLEQDGAPVTGSVALRLGLYDDAVGGTELWNESLAAVSVAGGHFSVILGEIEPLSTSLFNGAPLWLSITVDGTTTLAPRAPIVSTAYAFRAETASTLNGLEAADIPTVGELASGLVSVDWSSLTNAPVPAVSCGPTDVVIWTGQFECAAVDTIAGPHFTASDAIAAVVAAGYAPITCNAGDVLAWDGLQYVCEPLSLPNNALAAVSNGLLNNEFSTTAPSTDTPLAIFDNFPSGVESSIVIPNLGVVQNVSVTLNVTNSNVGSGLRIHLYDPDNVEYVLYDDGGASGPSLTATYPSPDAPVAGDLSNWIGRNAQGTWRLRVIDHHWSGGAPGSTDGQVDGWHVSLTYISNRVVATTNDLSIAGAISGSNGPLDIQSALSVAGDITTSGTVNGVDISAHASNPSAHHARYTDAEAVAAMGPKSRTNPLNHDPIRIDCEPGQLIKWDGSSWVCAYDSSAATLCGPGQFLNGDGTCDAVVVDTHAGTLCATGEYLEGGTGGCKPISSLKEASENQVVVPHSTVIGDYSAPIGAAASSNGSQTGTIPVTNTVNNALGAGTSWTTTQQWEAVSSSYTTTIRFNGQVATGFTGTSYVQWQYSNDAASWSTLGSMSWSSSAWGYFDQTYTVNTNTRYYRVQAYHTSSASTTLYAGVTATGTFTAYAGLLHDGSTSTRWVSAAQANPWFSVDMGTLQNIGGIALNHSAATTESQLAIEVSSDAVAWTLMRTISTASLTNSAWNYVRFPIRGARHVRVYGTSGASRVISANEVKVLIKTDTEIVRTHGHRIISPTDVGIPLGG